MKEVGGKERDEQVKEDEARDGRGETVGTVNNGGNQSFPVKSDRLEKYKKKKNKNKNIYRTKWQIVNYQ